MQYENTGKYIIKVIKDLDHTAKIDFDTSTINRFLISIKNQKVEIVFDRALMEDFEIAIQDYHNTDYYFTLENSLKFQIYIELGAKGLLSDFSVSSELLKERGEWLEKYSVDVSFNKHMCVIINLGLNRLSTFLGQILQEHDLELKDIRIEKDYIDDLIQYYKKNGHLSASGVGVQSLGFLKAAAICEIIDKERDKSNIEISRIKAEIDEEIYKIVMMLREAPFLGIKLPECILDYHKSYQKQAIPKNHIEKEKILNIKIDDKLDELLDNLDLSFKKKRVGAWLTFKSDNPDRLSQSANSMVELLDKVIGLICYEKQLSEYLEQKYGTHKETQWIDATRKMISETKRNLHRIKHHSDYKAEILAKHLLTSAESIMLVLLE